MTDKIDYIEFPSSQSRPYQRLLPGGVRLGHCQLRPQL